MTQPVQHTPSNPGTPTPSHLESDKLARQKAEESEVAGRHKNDGQKDHKGAR